MEMPTSRAEQIAEKERLLALYDRDLANDAMGHGPALSHEDYMRTEEEIKKLKKELEELKRGA